MTASEPDKQPQGVAGGDGSKENKPEADKPEECSWCKWMKGGGCKKEFEAGALRVRPVWLKCVDDVRDAGRDDVESCAGLMGPLWDCMQHNSAYYSPQLDSLASRKPGEVQLELSPKDRGPKDS
ncbi:GCK domain-containing protein [Haematococcus lacustris]|uniref:GCK domain-containing protein n=1 Tax=Haematococcus lacustris TaxID=44745 RepID=A0A699Z8Y2_HAELA|nr:GCK domain-containing protein [Haematococcus lacustris]